MPGSSPGMTSCVLRDGPSALLSMTDGGGETALPGLRRAEFPCIVKPHSGSTTGGMDAMKKLTMDNVVGFVLAILFALVIGFSMWGQLVGDYVNTAMNEQTRLTLRIVGFAGALAALSTWWVQNFRLANPFSKTTAPSLRSLCSVKVRSLASYSSVAMKPSRSVIVKFSW